jgi:hypothetical protein
MVLGTLRKLVSTVVGSVRTRSREEESLDDQPQYGVSVSYTPCPDCGEGTMTYDTDAGETRCSACGASGE